MDRSEDILEVLKRIEQNQHRQLEGLKDSLAVQRQQFDMAKHQFDRAEKLNDRAEKIQETSASIMKTARRSLAVVLPIVIILIIYLSWLLFR